MNKTFLMGRLTKDPDVRYSRQGDRDLAIARFTLAVDRPRRKDQQATADFISCVAFDRQAEFAEKYLSKGTKILIEGRIQTGSYVDQSGTKRYTTDVMISSMEFAESKASNEPQPYGEQNYQPPQQFGAPAPQEPPSGPAYEQTGFVPASADDPGLPWN